MTVQDLGFDPALTAHDPPITQRAETWPRGAPAEPRRARSWPGRLARVARRAAVPVLLIAAWQVAASAHWVDRNTLASPQQVWNAGWASWTSGQLGPSILISLRRILIGLAIGGSIGVVLGLFAGLSRIGEELVDAPMQMLRSLPFLGLIPLLIVWLGIGEQLKVGLVVIGVIYPIYINLYKGIRAIDPRFGELARACGVSRREVFTKIVLPGAMPSFLIGLRFSLGIAWLALVISETVNADKGIGYLISQAQQYLQTDVIVLGLALYALLGLILEGVVRLLERYLLRWRREFAA
jgi:sulfonate transport system permease protein